MKKAAVIGGVAVLAVSVSSCTMASTPPDQTYLHYSGGSLSSQKFKDCIPPSKRETDGPGDKHYGYPTRQVSYDASTDAGAERGRFSVVTKDGVEMLIPVSVTMNLITSCEEGADSPIVRFHETLGLKYHAYWDKGQASDESPGGWVNMLNFVVGKPLDATLDRIALKYDWREMRTSPEVKNEIDQTINNEIAELVERQADGEFFEDFSALTQKPDPVDEALLDAIANEQTAVTEARAQKAKAEADLLTARAERELAEAQANKQRAIISGYGSIEAYLKAQLIEQGGNPFQPTYIVGGTKPE